MGKYRIEVTEKQLALLSQAVELMMRTGMGQPLELAEWLVSDGEKVTLTQENFVMYNTLRNLTMRMLKSLMDEATMTPPSDDCKSPKVLELETMCGAFKHQLWLDADIDHTSYSVDGNEPMMWGEEPILRIEKVNDLNKERG